MTQEMLTAILIAAGCSAACSSTSFGTVRGEDGGAEEERTGVVEMLVDGGREGATVPEAGMDGGVEAEADGNIEVEASTDAFTEDSSSDAGNTSRQLFEECFVDADCFPPDLDVTCSQDPRCFPLFGYCRHGICTKQCGSTTGPCCENSVSCDEAVCRDFREISSDPEAAAVCTPPCTLSSECPENFLCFNGLCTFVADMPL